ncbi:hypothetical protein KCP75_17255 [Salmonella enterica subsp. enterica]|nr:hypothetical protein KCP75_17255 [Salmonella enterica subsp. enterica]
MRCISMRWGSRRIKRAPGNRPFIASHGLILNQVIDVGGEIDKGIGR